jgi:hypothetical protein
MSEAQKILKQFEMQFQRWNAIYRDLLRECDATRARKKKAQLYSQALDAKEKMEQTAVNWSLFAKMTKMSSEDWVEVRKRVPHFDPADYIHPANASTRVFSGRNRYQRHHVEAAYQAYLAELNKQVE